VTDNIGNVSLPREFCLNGRAYNIPYKIGDRYMKRKKKDKNRTP